MGHLHAYVCKGFVLLSKAVLKKHIIYFYLTTSEKDICKQVNNYDNIGGVSRMFTIFKFASWRLVEQWPRLIFRFSKVCQLLNSGIL